MSRRRRRGGRAQIKRSGLEIHLRRAVFRRPRRAADHVSVRDGVLVIAVEDRRRSIPVTQVSGVRVWRSDPQGHDQCVVLDTEGAVVLSLDGGQWQPWGGDRRFRALAESLGVPLLRFSQPERGWSPTVAVPHGHRSPVSWLRMLAGGCAALAVLTLMGTGRNERYPDPAALGFTSVIAYSAAVFLAVLDVAAVALCLASERPGLSGTEVLRPAITVTSRTFRRRARLVRNGDELLAVNASGQVLAVPLTGPGAPTRARTRGDRLALLSDAGESVMELRLSDWEAVAGTALPETTDEAGPLTEMLAPAAAGGVEQARLDGPQPDVGVLADRVVPVRAVLLAGSCGLLVLHLGALIAALGSVAPTSAADPLRVVAGLGALGSASVIVWQTSAWAWRRRGTAENHRDLRSALKIVVITFPLWAGGWTAFLTTTLATAPLGWVRPVVMIQAAFGAISVAVLAGFLLKVPLGRPQEPTGASPPWWGAVGVVGVFTGVLGFALRADPLGRAMLVIGLATVLLLGAIAVRIRQARRRAAESRVRPPASPGTERRPGKVGWPGAR